jgi:hypothetical protein
LAPLALVTTIRMLCGPASEGYDKIFKEGQVVS